MADIFKSLQPQEYYRKFLKHNTRPDGRSLKKFRPTAINLASITTAEGSAIVKLGNTTAVCGIKAELTTPKLENPKCGFIVPTVTLPPLCSSKFKPGPPSDLSQITTQFITDIVSNSKCISLEDLCVHEGKVVWVLYCDILCLDYNGNIADASLIALIAALKNVLLPKIVVDVEKNKITVEEEKLPLQVRSHPVSSTFAVFDDEIIFTDPTAEEEDVASGTISIAVMEDSMICGILKPGGSSLDEEKMKLCIDQAQQRAKSVKLMIDEAMATLDR